jgi:hypothetical protein
MFFEARAVNTLPIAGFICFVCIHSFTQRLYLALNVFHYVVSMSYNNRCCCAFQFWQVLMKANNTCTTMFTPSLNY